MKIVFLNVWGGTQKEELRIWIETQKTSVDVFCFMEANEEFKKNCGDLLKGYKLAEGYKNVINEDGCFQNTYIKNSQSLIKTETVLERDEYTGLGLFTQIGGLNILNVHGVAQPGDKLDNPKRIKQSREIIDFMAKIDGPKIIGGDFNLELMTESVAMFEKNGYRNLIKEFNIKTTRNRLIWERYPESKQYFADYVFVNPEVKIKNFEVPQNEISDHLPLILEIE